MPAVPPSDNDAASLLKGARSQAFAQLKQEEPGWDPVKAGNKNPPPKGPPGPPLPSAMPTTPRAMPSAISTAPSQTSMTPSDEAPQPPPPPPPVAANPASKPGFFTGAYNEIENGIVRGYAEVARAIAASGQGLAAAADAEAGGGGNTPDIQEAGAMVNKAASDIVKYWTPTQEETAQHGLGAQVLGSAASMVGQLFMPGAAAVIPAASSINAYADATEAGQDPKTAGIIATTVAMANFLGMKIPLKNPSIWKRIGSSILGNEVITTAQQALTKEILDSNGYKQAADNIDIADPKTVLTTLLTAIGFGIHRQAGASPKQADEAVKNGAKTGAPPPPPGPAGDEGAPPPSPPPGPTFAGAGVTSEGAPVTPVNTTGATGGGKARIATPGESLAATPPIPDMPSPESAKDIRAQIVDMNKTTPRVGVLITKDTQTILAGSKDANAASVNGTVNQARLQGRTVEVPTGTLVLKTKSLANKVQERLASGEDPQAVIGSVTGASPGTVKTPDQTVVVQGQTPTGAVASETVVAPDRVQDAKIKMEQEGKTPVVTTPEAAQARRLDEISKERNTPTELGLMTTDSGKQVPVHVESGAPDGLVRVRPMDANGEPLAHTVDVPVDRVQSTKPTEEAVPAEKQAVKQEATGSAAATSEASEETPVKTAGPVEGVNPPEVPSSESGSGKTVVEDTSRSPSEPVEQPKPVVAAPVEKRMAEEDGATPEQLKAVADALRKNSDLPGASRLADMIEGPAGPEPKPLEHVERNTPEQEAAIQQRDKTDMDAHGLRGYEKTHGAANEQPKATVTRIRPRTAFDALPEALEAHEKQEQIPEGKKFAAPLAERQDNASAFATVLREAAKSAAGKAAPDDIARATAAAKAAERLTEKGKVATDKGQGTSHTKITALVDEMHKAARTLLGTAKPGDETRTVAKEVELKAKIAKKTITIKKAAEKTVPKEGANEPKTEVPVNPKYKDQIKGGGTKEPPVDVQRKRAAERMLTEYVSADSEDAPKVRAKIEQWLHEEMSDTYTPDEQRQVLHMLDEQRRDQNPDATDVGPKKMSASVKEEESRLDANDKYEGMMRGGRELLSTETPLERIKAKVQASRLHDEWTKAVTSMISSGDYTKLITAKNNTGEHTSSHELLNTLMGHANTPILRELIARVRAHAPDVPVYMTDHPKDVNKDARDLSGAAGLFHANLGTINVGTMTGEAHTDPRIVLQTAMHEIVHSATAYELERNPGGELAKNLESLRQILENRMRSKYGSDVVDAHMDFFHGQAAKPDGYMRHLYGLKDVHELAAEVMSNPRFAREIAESEAFASPREIITTRKTGLLGQIFHAIGRFFGVEDPKLLGHIAGTTEDIMAKQHEWTTNSNHPFSVMKSGDIAQNFMKQMSEKFGTNPLEQLKTMKSFSALDEEPPKLRGVDDELHDLVGPRATLTARAFNWAIKNRGTDAVRTVVTRLKTMDQIFRDHRSDFGSRDDNANPLNRLEDVESQKNIIINRMSEISRPVAEKWLALKSDDEIAMSKLMRDATLWRIDPSKLDSQQPASSRETSGFENRYKEFASRFEKLSPEAKDVFVKAGEANVKLAREFRRAAVDTALHTLTDTDIGPEKRALLYAVKTGDQYERLIGTGKIIDVGERNDALKASLADYANQSEIEGYYQHLGRQGDYVVSAAPEGSKEFPDRASAEKFIEQTKGLSPDSGGKVVERGGKIIAEYKAKYVSMHEDKISAEAAAAKMRAAGYDVGHVTRKTLGREDTPIGAGVRDLVAAAESKISRGGHDEGTQALVASLRSAFLQMAASRSAYASSRLARKNFAGVKAEDMQRNFAEHATSTIWHAAQLRTVFDQASALSKVRDMARDSNADVGQRTMYRRGEVVAALNEHMKDEVQNFGHKAPLNSALAKLGFMSYLASPSHALIWMTQNFTTGIPVAGAKWGYGRAIGAFGRGMKVISPAFISTMHSVFERGGTASDVHNAIIEYVRNDKTLGKWAQGENSPLQQLIDKGVISHGYSNELGALARGDSATVARAFEWARLLPNMADAFNRVSTALAGLELSGGDIRQTADFVRQVHADYSQQNKPLLFKKLGRVPGMNSLTMFKTYTQSMAHLIFGNLKASLGSDRKAEAAKTVAGLIVANSLFAGVYAGAALEPLRLAMYAYHKLFDKEGEVYDLQNQIHNFLVSALGHSAGNLAAGGAIPRALGVDLSSRMGLSDLFFHNPPDLLSADKAVWKDFIYNEAGPMASFLAERVSGFVGHMQKGEPFQAISQLVPIKMYQDAVKAVELANSGKTDSLGRRMTQPSLGDAAKQLFGVKPESVANAQEKSSYSIEYKAQINSTKTAILKAVANGEPDAYDRLSSFNSLHPYDAIKTRDLRGIEKAAATDPNEGRNAELNDALRF